MIDLRSDTVTRPTDEMMESMRSATLGDDTLEGDPTVRQLEMRAAELSGKEDALFVVSGTMGNVIATLTHGRERGEAIVDEHSHMAKSEAGGISHLAGLYCQRIPSHHGEMCLQGLKQAVRPAFSRYGLPTAMIGLETSHNHSGGYVPGLDYMDAVADIARHGQVPVHIDGARAFNAAIALGVPLSRICAHADSVSLCLSKGLSAPMGAVLVGSTQFIERAKTFRRMVGGGLRQAGMMAAAGLVALNTMVDRLADDHRRIASLWNLLQNDAPELVDAEPPHTNILQIHVTPGQASLWEKKLVIAGILVRAANENSLRLVSHRHITDADILVVHKALTDFYKYE
jgi:threonine aldolase